MDIRAPFLPVKIKLFYLIVFGVEVHLTMEHLIMGIGLMEFLTMEFLTLLIGITVLLITVLLTTVLMVMLFNLVQQLISGITVYSIMDHLLIVYG